ncbi:Apoptogenic protein 1, mitochondrial, partial [Actinomortierella ambigua]
TVYAAVAPSRTWATVATTTSTLRLYSTATATTTTSSSSSPSPSSTDTQTSSPTTTNKRSSSRADKFLDPLTNRDKFLVGTAHPISNLRPVLYPIPANESDVDRQLRERRERVDAFNQDFWARNNAMFNQAKADYEAMVLEKNGGSPVTTEQMSVFYKDFLDKAYGRQMAYNRQWWIENMGLLWPSAKAVFRKWTNRS